MLTRSRPRTLFCAVLFLLAVGAFRVAGGWLYGETPYVQYLKWIHNNIPRFTVPVRLVEGTTTTFQARIIRKDGHRLNLIVYFTRQDEEAVVERLLGRPVAQPINSTQPHGKLPIAFRVTVHDQEQRVAYDQTVTSDRTVAYGSHFRARQLAELPPWDEGLYSIDITPLNDVSGLAPFRTELELTYQSK